MHEIITLQFGQQANYVGTHYWNTQESYFTYAEGDESPVNHDVSFRAGVGIDGQDTYTPRTIVYDLKGAFGTLRRENALYELEQQASAEQLIGWTGPTVPLRLPRIEPSPYQTALDRNEQLPSLTTDTVRFWSDYNHIFYHPRSIIQLNEYELNSSLMPFERHATGAELFAQLDRENDLLDRDLRPFLEECDQLQGIQILTGLDDAWGGFSACYLQRIADEMGKGCYWVFGSQHEQRRQARDRHALQEANIAQAISVFNSAASTQVPLNVAPASSPSYLQLDASQPWHTSALQATLIESATLPTRLRTPEGGRATLDMLETTLNLHGNRRIAEASLSVMSTDSNESTPGARDTRMMNGSLAHSDGDHVLDISLFPTSRARSSATSGRTSRSHFFSSIDTLRGSWAADGARDEPDEHIRDRFDREVPHKATYHTPLMFPVLSSSPPVFVFSDQPTQLRVKTSLATSTAIAQRLRGLEGTIRSLIGIDEREALCDDLLSMAEEYEDDFSDEDEGTDDD